MVSKHNMNKKLQDEAKHVPHYGLRKLSVGVASVLLGTTLFFGVVSAQADTATGQVGNGSDNESENDNANKLVDAKKVVLSQPTSKNTLNTNNANNVQSAQNTDSLAENKSVATANPQSSMDNDGVSVTLNRTEYNPQDAQAVQLTAQIRAQAGDKISFVIPQGAYQQPSYPSLWASGTTTSKTQSDGSTLITDEFTTGGSFSQTISLQPYSSEIRTLFSAGTTLIPVIIQKNGKEIGRVSFNQIIKPTRAPNFQRTKPSSQSVGKLAPNVDYQWTLNFNENPGTTSNSSRSNGPSQTINHGTTVTVPVPQGFVLNEKATEDRCKTGFGNMHWTASQVDGPGGDVVFVSHDHDSSFVSIVLVGHFTNQLTDTSQQVTASRKISIVQDTGNGTQLTATLPPFTDQLMSKSEDNPQGDIFVGSVHPAYGGGLDKYKLGEVPLSQNPDSISFWKYEVGNASAFNLTNVPVNIILPDGMEPTKLVLPTTYNSGKITYTLHRYVDAAHPDEITNGILNSGQTTINFTNLAGNVRSIQLTLATLDSGVDYTASDYSTSNGFRVYGYVSQKYANGTDVKVGDKLTSNLTIGDGSQHWTADQYVVAKKVQPISVTNFPYQYNTTPGVQDSGQVGLGWNSTNSNSDFANPTIYYVLPSNASFNSYKPISPKADVTSYKAKDGRTIVKVVYHNTTSQDFKYYGYDYLYLNNSADLPHSTSNYKIYLVVPDGMQVTGSNKVSSADLQYVENNANAYLVGSGNWIIESAKGTQIAEQSRGNKNTDLTVAGESDNHGSNKMTYTGSVINNINNELNNVTYDLNLPDTADGNSGFNFYLNEPVTVIDVATGKSLAGVQVKYSTTRVTLSENGQPTGGNFGTLPADIHQVRAVQVLFPSISIVQSVRVILNGIDPTIINDVNKTGYLSSSLYTTDNSLKPINVLPNSASASLIKVTGVLDKQKITVNYIDKVTGQKLYFKSMTGFSGADANYTTQSSIDKYVGQHYVLYQDETKGADLVYDNDSSKDQVYNVYFTHGTQAATDIKTVHETIHYVYGPNQPRSGQAAADKIAEVTFTRKGTTDLVTGKTAWQDWDQKSQTFAAVLSPTVAGYTADQAQIDKQAATDSKTVHETIHYVYGPKQPRSGQAAADKTAEVTFTRQGTTDLVTGHTAWQDWDQKSQTFAAVLSPTVDGYTADQAQIDKQAVSAGDQDIVKTVTYTADQQKITVNYIDKVTGQKLDSKSMNGLSGTDANYTTKSSIDKYKGLHYVLAKDETKGQPLVYDNDSSKDQVYNVYFIHETAPASESKTVHETIHYVYGPNQPRSGQAAADKTAEVTFTRKGTTDLVTGKTDWQPWDQDSQTFVAVPSPSVTGYTADQSQIDAQNVTVGDQDIVKTVTYTANPEIPNPSVPNVPNDKDSLKGKDFENALSPKGNSNNEVANNKQQLPQTGNDSNRGLGVVGLALTSIVSLIGLSGFKRSMIKHRT